MKRFLLIPAVLALTFVLATPAYAECIIGMDAMVPVMKHGAQAHKIRFGKGQTELTETASLKDGTKATYTAGGCDRFVFSYKFENIPGGVPEDHEDPFTMPLKLLSSIPFREYFDAELLVKALKDKQAMGRSAFDDNGTTGLPCPGTCTLTLGKESVTVGYDANIY
jgi:hypothetical protein